MELFLKNSHIEGCIEAGADEAGRGPLAGPVFAAAVILPPDFHHPLLNDSKQVNAENRLLLRSVIEQQAVSFAVEKVDAEEIDEVNILNASILGMQRCLVRLQPIPESIIIDGNKFRPFKEPYTEYNKIPLSTIVKGDATYASIAAASILAKTYRDEYMLKLAEEFPMYGWDKNMGYPTAAHIEAIRRYGYCRYHRKSFHVKELEPTLF